MKAVTLEDCRALRETIDRHGGPQPHHRQLYARACRQLEEAEALAEDGLSAPPILVALGWMFATVLTGLTVYGGVRIADRVADSTATAFDRAAVVAVIAASLYAGIVLFRFARKP